MAESHRDEIAKLEALHASNPDGRVFTHLAEAYRKGGALDRAREVLDQGMAKHPDYSSAHVVMGRVLVDQGDTEAAVRAFTRVLELDRHNLVALRSLGELLGEAGRAEEALVHYRELAMLDPSDPELRATVESLEESLAQEPESEASVDLQADGTEATVGLDAEPETEGEPVDGEVATAVAAGPDGPGDTDPSVESIDYAATLSPGATDAEATGSPDPGQGVEAASRDGGNDIPEQKPKPPAGPPFDWEELAGPEPALPGDLAAIGEEADTGNSAADLEFFDFRATSLTEHGWAETGSDATAKSEGNEAARDDTTVPEAELVIDDLEVAPTDPHLSDAGAQELPAEWGQTPTAADDVAGDGDEPADIDIASIEGTPEREIGEPRQSGEWLSGEDWARLRTAESGLEADSDAQTEAEDTGAVAGAPKSGADPGALESGADAGPVEEMVDQVEPDSDADAPGAGIDTESGIDQDAGPEWYEVAMDAAADDTVVTETMAELYAKQGFHDRSVEIYRALVRERPDDEELRERLRQAESVLQRSTRLPTMTSEADATGGANRDQESGWAEEVESVWTGGSGVAGGDPTPYAWTETEGGGEARGEIGAYFRSLLAWEPRPSEQPLVNLDASSIVEDGSGSGAGDSDAAGNWFERAGAAGAETVEEDEDLNTFRAWLQSLKK